MAQRISNTVPTRSVHPFEIKALQVLTPMSSMPRRDWLSLKKYVWSMMRDQVELLTRQKVASQTTQSHNCNSRLPLLLSDERVRSAASFKSDTQEGVLKIVVLDCEFVKSSVVHHHPETPSLLFHKKDRCAKWAS